MPPEHVKHGRDLEAKIFAEHRKLQGMTELNAKFRYVQLCRSLKTYGVTFFSVKEKVPKKNKMVETLLGVTRDSVMRLDAETKVSPRASRHCMAVARPCDGVLIVWMTS